MNEWTFLSQRLQAAGYNLSAEKQEKILEHSGE